MQNILENYLEFQAWKGLEARGLSHLPDYQERLKYELEVINKMGFAGYFLIVWDVLSFARNNNIPLGPGRGSAAGSLVSYALRITNLDPIKRGLIFERFLNPARMKMPDFGPEVKAMGTTSPLTNQDLFDILISKEICNARL